jgi:caffeoyl-CoA O-methyltransferase
MTRQKLEFWDKLLCNQPEYARDFTGIPASYHAALYQAICRSSGLNVPTEEFRLELSDKVTIEEIGSNPVAQRFLEMLVRMRGARRVLEVGTFLGITSMCLARALPPDGDVVTFEKFDHFAAIARKNFALNGYSDKITLIEGDAFDAVDRLRPSDRFDVIFIDGNKERYRGYFEKLEPHLAPQGLMIIDDCFFHGDAINEHPTTEKGAGVKAFLDYAATRADYDRIALPLSNGIMLMLKRD